MTGGLLSDILTFSQNPDIANLGASGAIFGLSGAYLYVFPFSRIRIFGFALFGFIPRIRIFEWQARWVVVYYLGLNILEQLLSHGQDGVGHFAHLGGAGAGLLCVWLMQTRRDSEDISDAQATHADAKDLTILSFPELEALMQRPTEDPRLVMTFCEKALITPGAGEARCLPALQHYARLLMDRGDPNHLAGILLQLSPESAKQMPTVYYLRLGSRLETASNQTDAARMYRRVAELFPTTPDAEVSWFRMGRLQETYHGDRAQAAACYTQLLQRFPQGTMAADAKRALENLKSGGAVARISDQPAAEPATGGATGMLGRTTDDDGVRYDLAGNPL